MFRLAIGFVIGYMLGAKAGRERYEQMARLSSKVADHPAVQAAAGVIQAKVSRLLPNVGSQDARKPDPAYLDVGPVPTPTTGSASSTNLPSVTTEGQGAEEFFAVPVAGGQRGSDAADRGLAVPGA